MNRKIVENVFDFIGKTASIYGQMMAERFAQEMHSNCIDVGMQSPIEDMFWIACNAICEAEYQDVNPEFTAVGDGNYVGGHGVHIKPQALIGTYRVDFLVSQHGIGPISHLSPIVVELDGHDFHDKDKRQRSYEKARDRFLVKHGFRVVHFTGSDVVKDPFKVAFEVLEMIGVFTGSEREYNHEDPLGLG